MLNKVMVQENVHVNAEIAIAMQKHQRYAGLENKNKNLPLKSIAWQYHTA
jgi:hypothetical protein